MQISAKDPTFIDCGNASLFELIGALDAKSSHTLHRVCTLMRLMEARTLIVEPLKPRKRNRLSLETKAIERRLKHRSLEFSIKRLTFLQRRIASFTGKCPDSSEFLGQVVLINIVDASSGNTLVSYIFEAVIREFGADLYSKLQAEGLGGRMPWVPYLHVSKRFVCHLYDGRWSFEISGTYFCQQNTITNVCAHACTSMLINNCRLVRDLVTCEELNQQLGIDHENRMQDVAEHLGSNERATHEGLLPKEIARVLRDYGLHPVQHDFQGNRRRYYREFLYGFIESGFPALLTFNNFNASGDSQAHVVAVVGHSLNRHSWFPQAYASYVKPPLKEKQYISSLNWVDDFIVHDDNFGMQLYLPAHSFRPEDYPDPGAAFMPTLAMGILPASPEIKMLAHIAEGYAWQTLRKLFQQDKEKMFSNHYVDRIREFLSDDIVTPKNAVIRTFLMETSDYLEHLKTPPSKGDAYPPETLKIIASALRGVDKVWISEITEPDLYVGNAAKVIDVLMDPSFDERAVAETKGEGPVLLVRFPGQILKRAETGDGLLAAYSIKGIVGHMPLAKIPLPLALTELPLLD